MLNAEVTFLNITAQGETTHQGTFLFTKINDAIIQVPKGTTPIPVRTLIESYVTKTVKAKAK